MPGSLTVTPPEEETVLLDEDSAFWYNAFGPMVDKLLQMSQYSDIRRKEILYFFAVSMVPFLGSAPKLSARRWRSFMTPDNTPMEPSLSWSASRSAPKTRLAIDIIPHDSDQPNDTINRSLDFAQGLRDYSDSESTNTIAIKDLDLVLFYAIATELFIPIMDNESTIYQDMVNLVSGPSLTFFGIDVEEVTTKVKAYFVPELSAKANGESSAETLQKVFDALCTAPALGNFAAWTKIMTYMNALPADDTPIPFILSVDCVPRENARFKVYFRCRCRNVDELVRIMSLDGTVDVSPGHVQGVIEMWNLLRPNTETLQSQELGAESGLCVYYDFKQSSQVPAVKVYLPIQNWVSNDLKAANAITAWLGKFGHPESAESYRDFVSSLCNQPLVRTCGFHTYIGISPARDGGCEATTYYNMGLFDQEVTISTPSSSRIQLPVSPRFRDLTLS